MRVKELFAFIKERHSIYLKKRQGLPKPWTKDPILQKYKFTNVYRELDRVTDWINGHWRNPNVDDSNLWFAMAVARLVNWPDTLRDLHWIVGGKEIRWKPSIFVGVLHTRRENKEQVFGPAYIVSTNGRAMDKAEYLAQHVLTPLWERRRAVVEAIRTKRLAQVHLVLCQTQGIGSFIGAQIIADLRDVPPLNKAEDLNTWAASGPGSRRGLNRVMGRPVNNPWNEVEWLAVLQALGEELKPLVKKAGMPPIHLQNLQNSNCEFDKYERTRNGEGRPKTLYPGI